MQTLRQMAVLIGCFLGGFLAVQLAQATWTTPRTWVTGEVVGAGQVNTHVRDNLTYLYNALTSLDASDTTSGVFDVARIPDLGAGTITSGTFGQARLAADSVGTSQVRTAIGSTTGSQVSFADGQDGDSTGQVRHLFALHDYAFMPSIACAQAADEDGLAGRLSPYQEQGSGSAPTDTVGRFAMDGDCSTVRWRYLTSSDTPSIWVVSDRTTGAVLAVWEAEDPLVPGDTQTPLVADDPTHRVVNVGVPSLAVITTLYDALTTGAQADLITKIDAYVAGERGWLSAVTTLADVATIETRYEPSGRQWAMRFLAEVQGIAVTDLYRTALRVDPLNTWAIAR